MLTSEQYKHLSSHVAVSLMNLDAIIKKVRVLDDVDLMDLITGSKEDLMVMQDVLDFLVFQDGSKN
jgi:hypothetical protein